MYPANDPIVPTLWSMYALNTQNYVPSGLREALVSDVTLYTLELERELSLVFDFQFLQNNCLRS